MSEGVAIDSATKASDMPRLLIVEGSATQAIECRALLEEAGFEVAHYSNPQAALDLLRDSLLHNRPWDAVLTAYSLSPMTGVELCQTIKDDPQLRATAVILLTASGDVTHALESLAAGADGYLVKEGIAEELPQRVRRILERVNVEQGSEPAERIERTIEHGGRSFQCSVTADLLFDVLRTTLEDLGHLHERCLESARRLRRLESPDRETTDAIACEPSVAEGNRDRRAESLRVLLAEDSPTNQILARGLLTNAGYSVMVVSDGREAVAQSQQEMYDVILMDVQMPEMDGLEATRLIREEEQTTGVHRPILAMTAHSDEADRAQCLAAGMDGFLSKPLKIDALQAALAALEE